MTTMTWPKVNTGISLTCVLLCESKDAKEEIVFSRGYCFTSMMKTLNALFENRNTNNYVEDEDL